MQKSLPKLSKVQEEMLRFIYDEAVIPIDWPRFMKEHGIPKDAFQKELNQLVREAWLDSEHRLNNKAMAYGIVVLQVPVAEWRRHFEGAIEGDMGWQMIHRRLRKEPKQEEYVNVMTYHTYKRYLELNAFDFEGGFQQLWSGDMTSTPKEATGAVDFIRSLIDDLLDDGRIPPKVVLRMYGAPEKMIERTEKSGGGITKDDARVILRDYFGLAMK